MASALLLLSDTLGAGKNVFVVLGASGVLVTNHYRLEKEVENAVRVFDGIADAKE